MSGLRHETVARRLVHLLKYQAMTPAAVVLGAFMAVRIPFEAKALVPVPRAWARRVRYGVDPAYELAQQMKALTGLPVISCLRAAVWWPSHAGLDKVSRRPPRFHLVRPAPPGSVLVDDVITTGSTLAAASALCSAQMAITATQAAAAGHPGNGTCR